MFETLQLGGTSKSCIDVYSGQNTAVYYPCPYLYNNSDIADIIGPLCSGKLNEDVWS